EALDERGVGVLDALVALGFEAFAGVLKIRLRPREPLVEHVALGAELWELVRIIRFALSGRRFFQHLLVVAAAGWFFVVNGNACHGIFSFWISDLRFANGFSHCNRKSKIANPKSRFIP